MQVRTKQTIKIYWQHSKPYKGLIFLMTLGMLLSQVTELYRPFLYKQFFDLLTMGPDNISALVKVLYFILLAGFANWIFQRINNFSAIFMESKVMEDLMNFTFRRIHQHSYTFFSNNFTGSLVRKATRYERSYEEIVDQIFGNIGPALIKFLVIAVILSAKSFAFGAVIFAWVILYVIMNYWFIRIKLKYDLERVRIDSRVSGDLADTITNSLNLKIFSSSKREEKLFSKLNSTHTRARQISWMMSGGFEALQGALMVMLEFAIFYLALIGWQNGTVTVGDFAFLQAYLVQWFRHLWDLGRNFRRVYEAFADANEMTEILEAEQEVKDQSNKKLKVDLGRVGFRGVDFGYNKDRLVFKNFTLQIEPGEKVALVGPSGGGKSTVVKLLLRFLDVNKGSIEIDGQDISKYTQDSLREAIAFVPQEPVLFHRTLFENIAYGDPQATKEDVYRAAKLAHCDEFIQRLPEKYEAYVGERGVKLSGGERQRVAIARAILKNAPILVLDEATSSLDSESEMLIQDALKHLMEGKTVIVIAHRLSTIMQMDRILVIEDGKIIEEGRHEELVKAKQGMYQKLWNIQAGSFNG
jgi:ATP-binding cassette, subfamily B, bacterial